MNIFQNFRSHSDFSPVMKAFHHPYRHMPAGATFSDRVHRLAACLQRIGLAILGLLLSIVSIHRASADPSGGSTGEVLLIGSGSRVLNFDAANGAYLGDFISGYTPGLVYDLRIGPGGDLYLMDYIPRQIHRFDGITGAYIEMALQVSGGVNGEFAIGPEGDFYVGQGDRINRYDGITKALQGSIVPPLPNRTQPAGMFVDGGDFFVSFLATPGGGGGVWRFDSVTGANGQNLVSGLPGNGPRQPFKLNDGRLLVPVWQNNRIERFSPLSYTHEGFWNQIGSAHSLAYSAGGALIALIDQFSASSVKTVDENDGSYLGEFIPQGSGGMGRASSFVRHSLPFEPGVSFADSNLEAALRTALAKPTGNITASDLLTLTNLNLSDRGITDLSGLEQATNLRILDLRRNAFADAGALWSILDQLSLYCLYVDVRRPGSDPAGLVTQTLTDTLGNPFFVTVDAPNLPTLDITTLGVDTGNPANISALQTIASSGVAVDTGGVNLPPYANASATVVDVNSAQVELSAGGSSDVDGSISSYAWSWTGGSASGSSATVTLPYGETVVTLTVTDDDGSSGTVNVTVAMDKPYSAPVVSNLTAIQGAGTRLVDITYDVSADTPSVIISLRVSNDSGATFGVLATSLTGDIGPGVTAGTGRTITWDAGTDWPEQLSETVRFEVTADDGVGTPEGMALVSGGSFPMGRTSGETFPDAPPVSVTVGAFFIGKNEVSKALWDEVQSWGLANGYTDLPAGAGKAANHPVQMVSWLDAVKWSNARSEKDGLTPVYSIAAAVMKTGTAIPTVNWSANGYRLPTEAEWEKAARGGLSGKRFPSGMDTISQDQANYFASPSFTFDLSGTVNNYHPTFATGGFPYTSPVASFAPNAYGLHDMTGNVWEWCWDLYGSATYSDGATDPKGAASGTNRVNRGGGWSYTSDGCSAAFRSYDSPTLRHRAVGFRVVRTVVP